MGYAIKTEGLIKRYKDKTAVAGLTLTVNEGELIALLGVNGAGKTTTVKMLTCLTKPSEGKAEIMGCDVIKDPDEVKRLVGISPQDTSVAENLTVKENLEFMADLYLPKEKSAKAVEKTIKAFGLEEFKDKKSKLLSGGYKRKLSIAMAIIGGPKVLFLDEPTLGLDVLARRQLWREIEALKKNMTIVLTTHYMEEAQALADRIVIMNEGKVMAIGTLAELENMTGKKGLEDVFVSIAEKAENDESVSAAKKTEDDESVSAAGKLE
ncbi:MAG: ATP-binding cassette domain-containing protein [Clostridiales bacterium]|nr:ATP-binding cassette domain-containing protein [Clostridiales bacterium]